MRILLDCDGVMSDFIAHVLHEVNAELRTDHTHDDIDKWEMYEALAVPTETRAKVDQIVMSPGFCAGLPEIEGAREGVPALRAAGHKLYCVTAPFIGHNWMPERVQWLRRHMGFDRKHVVFCYDKELIFGDVLVDDKIDNLLAWQAAWPNGRATLFEQPWNRRDERWTGLRAKDWLSLLQVIGVMK